MAGLNYVGRVASEARHLVTKLETDNQLAVGVSLDYVRTKTAEVLGPLATKEYVDMQDSQFAHITDVDQKDGLLLPKSQRNTNGGTVGLDASGLIPVSYLPTVGGGIIKGPYFPTARYGRSSIPSGSPQSLAYWSISNPGFGWWPIVFGNVRFWTEASASGGRGRGGVECRIGSSSNSGYVVSQGIAMQPSGNGGDIHTAYVVPASHATGETAGGGYTGAVTVYAWAHNRGASDSRLVCDDTNSIRLALYLIKTS